mmetsp:Transcript_80959/g.203727  ORF Transcript_80959/g.203727 Transcript_80959/m.203727 type:complete len:252 (+) Transcript_80959:65-820(+)
MFVTTTPLLRGPGSDNGSSGLSSAQHMDPIVVRRSGRGGGVAVTAVPPSATSVRRSLAALATWSLSPSTTTWPSSTRSVTLHMCARFCRASEERPLGLTATASSAQAAESSSRRLAAAAAPAEGPKRRTSRRVRSMCTRQPVSSCRRATMACSGSCIVRVRISSAHTAADTGFRGPQRLESCFRTAWMEASEPQTRSVLRVRSSFKIASQLVWMSRSRRRLLRQRAPRSSSSKAISTTARPPPPPCDGNPS